jgi:hypothetical protein
MSPELSRHFHRCAGEISTLTGWALGLTDILGAPALGAIVLCSLSACGSGDGNGYGGYVGGPPPQVTSYAGTTGVFVAWADPGSGNFAAAPTGSFAGKRQILRGELDFLTGTNLGQPAGTEIYKGSDGHIHALDLTTVGLPQPQQISSETLATVDDTCSLTGTAVAGANSDYAGVYFAADLQNPTNSTYFYRLPGPDGVCDTPDDVVRMVKTGMSASDAPITVSAMPVATVRTSLGGISGFVAKSGVNLVLVDGNFANPVILGTFAAPIGVAIVLPVGTIQGFPTGQLYAIDGSIVYVDYVAHTTSAPLYSIPHWTAINEAALFAASPTTLYFSVNTPATPTVPASGSVYSMPADGSAAPVIADLEGGSISELQFPVQSNNLVLSVGSPTYVIRALSVAGGAALTLLSSAQNGGTFTATAADVYYTTWMSAYDSATKTETHSATQSGIVDMSGSVVLAPVANSSFLVGGEQAAWPDDTITTQTAYVTMFQITGLSPVTVTDPATGEQFIEDGVSGGTMVSIDTTSNQVVATIGTLPTSTATLLRGTFRGSGHTGFVEATTAVSTEDPATRDLYLLNSQSADTLTLATGNL